MSKYQHPVEKKMHFSNLVELSRHQAAQRGDKTSYIFLADNETRESQCTYRELDQKAKAIAALLQSLKLSGERALLIYPPGLDFIYAFFGCLYAGVIAVPIYPPMNRQMMSNIKPIISDSDPVAILTTNKISVTLKMAKPIQSIGNKFIFRIIDKSIDKFFPQLNLLKNKDRKIIATDEIDPDLSQLWQKSDINSDSLAFLQYTSGSTSKPKGVMISHGNILHNQNLIQEYFRQPSKPVFVSWLPQYHDMGLIGNILHPFYMGGKSIIISPFSFLKKPLIWLSAISKFKAYTSGGPNFGYELCVRKIRAEDKQHLDLSSWKVAYNGAEPIRPSTLEKFTKFFAECGFQESAFYPCYGLAEGTLIATGAKKNDKLAYLALDKKELNDGLVKCANSAYLNNAKIMGTGVAFNRQKIRVVDPENCNPVGDNKIGEIWISGPSVAQGYWNNKEATRDTFQARIRNSEERAFLRTGDLGFLREGELFITGRIKDLIIIRGQNYYPQDIEYTTEDTNTKLRKGCSAAFSVEADGQEKLVIVCEIRKKEKKAELKSIAAGIHNAILQNHGIAAYQIVLIKAKTIPKTTSGKIQRKKCKMLLLNNELDRIFQWHDKKSNVIPAIRARNKKDYSVEIKKTGDQSREQLRAWVLERIINISTEKVSIGDIEKKNIEDTGIDSLRLAELISDFEKEYDCNVDLKLIIEVTSLADFFEALYNSAHLD